MKNAYLPLFLALVIFQFYCTKEKTNSSQTTTQTATNPKDSVVRVDSTLIPKVQGFRIECYGSHVAALYSYTYNADDDLETGFVYAQLNMPTVQINEGMTKSTARFLKDTIRNLKSQTTYYVRSYAKNKHGVGYSDIDSFTTYGPPPPLTIGMEYQGGIIVSFDCSARHGTIMAERDLTNSLAWTVASRICGNSELNGYDDWSLPSYYDLNSAYKNRAQLGNLDMSVGGFYDQYWTGYWRKDPDGSVFGQARAFDFGNGEEQIISDLYKLRVRMVRYF